MLYLSKHDKIENIFPNWRDLPVEDREEIRVLLNNANNSWCKQTLIQKYGLSSDSDNQDSNSRISPR